MNDARTLPQKGRLAPSPTGGLHVGHARTFLIAWLAAKATGGHVLLRIEDIDTGRVRPGATQGAIEDLQWLGLDWESPVYVQSERLEAYKAFLERLKRLESVYPCTCTRAEIERAASAPHAEEEGPRYPGTCARRSASDGADLESRGVAFAWRFRVPDESIAWDDLFLGRVELSRNEVGGDFIVARSPFAPSYQLACAFDDADTGVMQVVRGEDLVPSTPRQILLHRAFGKPPPVFGHVPLVLGLDGKRLAKRDGAIKLSTLRQQGVDPRRLIGILACSIGLSSEVEPSQPEDWITRFHPDSLPRHSWTIPLCSLYSSV